MNGAELACKTGADPLALFIITGFVAPFTGIFMMIS